MKINDTLRQTGDLSKCVSVFACDWPHGAPIKIKSYPYLHGFFAGLEILPLITDICTFDPLALDVFGECST